MALDLEEQEQIAALKSWWMQHGSFVVLACSAVAIAIVAWQGWGWYQRSQAQEAGALYGSLEKAVQAGDAKGLRDTGGALAEGYPRTLYASMGALVAARFYFDRGDLKNAKAQLQWVLERSGSEDLRSLARLRLVAVLLDEQAYEEALRLLSEKPPEAYAAQYAAARGDVLVAKKQIAEAKAAYALALDKAQKDASAFRESVRMRLDALGG